MIECILIAAVAAIVIMVVAAAIFAVQDIPDEEPK